MLRVILWAVILIGWAAGGGTLAAAVAAILRRWPLASKIARAACFVGLAAFAVPVVLTLLVMLVTSKTGGYLHESTWGIEGADPSEKARNLAESISEMMNCGAFAFLAAVASGALWVLARWRIRRLEGSP